MKSRRYLTVFTPAYNRAHTIKRTYDSLCRQTSKDFEWLIIDDGSSDGTKKMVEDWITEAKIPIRYIYQDNQGMHGAHNTAIDNLNNTVLAVCIDSDDWMPDDAVEKIINFWKKSGDDTYAGIIGLDVNERGDIIGDRLPATNSLKLHDYYKNGGKGDKKIVVRTDLLKHYPKYPQFRGEKYFSLGYKYHLINQTYDFVVLNEPLAIVEYQLDGSSHSMWKQYWNNPNGFMFLRLEYMRLYESDTKLQLSSTIHYISHCIRAKKYLNVFKSPHPLASIILAPIGLSLFCYNWWMVLRNKRMQLKIQR